MKNLLLMFSLLAGGVMLTQKAIPLRDFVPRFTPQGKNMLKYQQTIAVEKLYQLFRENHVTLVDTRQRRDFERKRITGAIHVSDFARWQARGTCVYYGYSQDETYARSQISPEALESGSAYILRGGFQAWDQLDLPTTKELTLAGKTP